MSAVTGERIRDKIAASKAKGMWMGGLPPLGYDVHDRKLVLNQTEADTVRSIIRRYADLKSVRALKEELDAAGLVSKARLDCFGHASGSKPISRGALYLMVQNRIYRGEIVHKDTAYPGLHEAIIDEALWDDVQAALAENRVERITRSKAVAPSLLAGLVYDANGERMSPTYANKKGTRYRYYIGRSLIKRSRPQASETACRVPAADLESIVEQRICTLLRDQTTMLEASGTITVAARKMLIVNAADLARRWPTLPASDRQALLHALIVRIDVGAEAIEISVRPVVLATVVTPDFDLRRLSASPSPDGTPLMLSVPARLKRTGMEMTLLVQGALSSEPQRKHDRSLRRLIAQAQRLSDLVMNSKGRPIQNLAVEAGVSPSYFTRIFRLSFLAPEITTAIVQGRQPPELSAIKLLRAGRLRLRWPDQRRQLGFD